MSSLFQDGLVEVDHNPILQKWVCRTGLRHQGVLLSAVRGCDVATKDDPSKRLIRCYRAAILRPFCGDVKKAATYIEAVSYDELMNRLTVFSNSFDHYPLHYVTHLMHAAQVVGYKGPKYNPDGSVDHLVHAVAWAWFYGRLVKKLHLACESEVNMDKRLNASEEDFRSADRA